MSEDAPYICMTAHLYECARVRKSKPHVSLRCHGETLEGPSSQVLTQGVWRSSTRDHRGPSDENTVRPKERPQGTCSE